MLALDAVGFWADSHLFYRPNSFSDAQGRQYMSALNRMLAEVYNRPASADMIFTADVDIQAGGYDISQLEGCANPDAFVSILTGTMRTKGEAFARWKPHGHDDLWPPFSTSGVNYTYRLRRNTLELSRPAEVTFDYIAKALVIDENDNFKPFVTLDTDLVMLPQELIIAGVDWQYRSVAQLPYDAAMQQFINCYNAYTANRREARVFNTNIPDTMQWRSEGFDPAVFGKVGG